MSVLTDFILARISEDEAAARAAAEDFAVTGFFDTDGKSDEWVDHFARHDPARVLAQCAALRRIVAEHEMTAIQRAMPEGYWWDAYCRNCTMDGEYADITKEPREQPCPTLRALASIWAGHPDYDPEWRLT